MVNLDPAFARPPVGAQNPGIGVGGVSSYADGFKLGAVQYRFGTRESVTRDLPGWYVADGTQPALVIDGVSYGSPDLTKRVIVGADGSAGFTIGATGGSSGVAAHNHSFTQPSAHVITQPVFADHSTISHSNNHSGATVAAHNITQPVFAAPSAHADHTGTAAEFSATPGSGIWINTYNSALNAAAGLQHSNNHVAGAQTTNVALDNNHTVGQATAHGDHTISSHSRTVDVALTNNHSGGAVGAVSSPSTGNYPLYVAVWPLLKVFG